MPRLSKIGAAALAAFGWTAGATVTASYLVVAGGGGGASGVTGLGAGGGGGAGGFLTATTTLNPTLSYTVTVGAGGAYGTANTDVKGSNGSNSVFNSITSTGGGGGGCASQSANSTGANGGSGGGGGQWYNGSNTSGGTGTSGQGNNGGGGAGGTTYNSGGGGGGAGAIGGTFSGATGGSGGVGLANPITGSTTGQLVSSTYYLAGGGGAYNGGTGGTGGGGASGTGVTGNGVDGTANLGGGGGGSYTGNTTVHGGNGGSGVVIISYPAPQKFGGGVVTTSGSNVIHTFNTSGTLSPLSSLTASYAIVAGGGGGGSVDSSDGGGGAGGLLSGSSLTIDSNSIYVVTVGAGGSTAASGSNSAFSMVTTAVVGGGYGANTSAIGGNGGSGGGGAGGSGSGNAGGTATSGQGFAGGNGLTNGTYTAGGGGGGASAAGANATTGGSPSLGKGGAGGNGIANPITGSTAGQLSSGTYYLAGGGGGGSNAGSSGDGGTGGGGNGQGTAPGTVRAGVAGTANTGGGGGGGGGNAGGSGVVIVSYAGSTQQMAGGTVTITGGNVIHTFTSSGYLTPIKYVNNSLRFRSSASAYLNRTFKTPTSGTTWTWSGWVKRGILTAGTGTAQQLFSAGSATAFFRFSTTDTLISGWTGASNLETTAVYRDPAAWYHIMLVVDTTQATSSNRVKYYVNGVQITAFSTTDYPTQNSTTTINSAVAHNIGAYQSASQFFDGYLTEVNFIDGQALTPNSFGTFNSYGVWQPITYGGSYGTNGFYLPFSNTASPTTLAYDFSPNGNNWTPNNISTTTGVTYDSMTDVPTLTSATAANYPVLNPLTPPIDATLSNANLSIAYGSAVSRTGIAATMGMTTGKFYWEVTVTASSVSPSNAAIGISNTTDNSSVSTGIGYYPGYTSGGWGYDGAQGYKYNNASGVAYGATYTTNNVIGVAFDATAGSLTFYKDNVSQGVAYSGLAAGTYFPAVGDGGSGTTLSFAVNFGQRPFSYTPPTGFVGLNTYNM